MRDGVTLCDSLPWGGSRLQAATSSSSAVWWTPGSPCSRYIWSWRSYPGALAVWTCRGEQKAWKINNYDPRRIVCVGVLRDLMLNCLKRLQKIYSHFELHLGFGLTQVDEITSGTTVHILPYTVNTLPADALATLGARASAGMVLISKAGILRLQHQKS